MMNLPIRNWDGTKPPDVHRIRTTYSDLMDGITHAAPCTCPSCFFALYNQIRRKPGPRFDRESFFLSWLATEIRFSMTPHVEAYVAEDDNPRYVEKKFFDIRQYLKTRRRYISVMSDFLKQNFKQIKNTDPRRLKMKLRRLQKSKIEMQLTRIRISQGSRPSKESNLLWKRLKFAQRVADFIKSQRGREASYNKILRHFSNKRRSDIEDVRDPRGGIWFVKGTILVSNHDLCP